MKNDNRKTGEGEAPSRPGAKKGDVMGSTGSLKCDKRVEVRRTLKKAYVLKLDDNNNFELAAA